MPTSREAIERFIGYKGGQAPWPVKGRSVDELVTRVERLSGAPYDPITVPRPHQLEALAFGLEIPQWLLFMKMRLGKSKTLLDWARQLRAGGRWNKGKGLIITPRPVVSDVWETEFKKHSDFKFRIIRNDIQDMYEAIDSDADFVVAALTGLQVMFCPLTYSPRKERRERKLDLQLAEDVASAFSLAGIDEIHKCSNPETVNFKVAAALTQDCRYFCGLTGTPIGRDPFKIWAQAFLTDRGKTLSTNYYFFQTAFGRKKPNRFTPSGFETVFDDRLLPDLERKLDRISLSYGWDGYIEMPEVTRSIIDLKMSDEQEDAYRTVIDKIIQTRGETTPQAEAVFVKLRQISSGFLPYINDNGDERMQFFKDASKLQWLEEFLDELHRDTKVVIFHDFIPSGQLICNHLKLVKLPHLWLYGGTKDKTTVIRKFQNSKTDNILVTNPAVSELGLDFSVADYLCFYESPVSPIVRQQAEARPMSAERKDRPLYIDDLVSSPVERRILEFIREGRTLMADLIYREIKQGAEDGVSHREVQSGRRS